MSLPTTVKLVDVGPRDGLQNEKGEVPAAVKIELVHRLQDAGLKEIEATSYVSPKWVPQMADAPAVMAGIERRAGVRYSVLTPNLKGLESAMALDKAFWPDEIVVFAAASERFSQRNINCSIDESIERFRPVVELARALCTEPKLLLLDEPSSGLNVEETDDMAFWIQDIKHDLGITVLMVEHDMTLVSRVSDRVLAMAQGEPLAIGTPREVQSDPRVIEAYLGAVEDMSFLRRTEPFKRTRA
jgi:hypothetical protein